MNTLAHEIPKGSRLYFGKSAAIKRQIETVASALLAQNGYEEIVTPNFSYLEYQSIDDVKSLIRTNDDQNRFLTLRGDSTLDVVRLITNRLGRSTAHKKWFYIQPVFSFPSNEHYQIGLEEIGNADVKSKIALLVALYKELNITPYIQLSNIKIAQFVAESLHLGYEEFKHVNIDTLLSSKHRWIKELVLIQHPDDIDTKLAHMPSELAPLLIELSSIAKELDYANLLVSPLYYANMKYYESIIFKSFLGNNILANGGTYTDNGVVSSGFALYTDNLIEGLI